MHPPVIADLFDMADPVPSGGIIVSRWKNKGFHSPQDQIVVLGTIVFRTQPANLSKEIAIQHQEVADIIIRA